MKKFYHYVFILLVFSLLSCDEETQEPASQFYSYQSVKKLALEGPTKSRYILGIDSVNIPLKVTAYDANGTRVDIPDKIFRFYANSELLSTNRFDKGQEGTYSLTARLGNVMSNSLNVEVYDQNKLKLTVSREGTEDFIADGKSKVSFKTEMLSNGKSITIPGPITFRVNGAPLSGSQFSTQTPGQYQVKAEFGSLSSNTLFFNAISPIQRITLSVSGSKVFYADNNAVVRFNIQAFDRNNAPVSLTDDIKLLIDGQTNWNYNQPFRTNIARTYRFQLQGYGISSNEVSVTSVQAPTLNLVRIPVVFHTVNTRLTQEQVNNLLSGVNRAFRNSWNPTGITKDDNAADMMVEFTLATTDPQGRPMATPGIDPVTTNQSGYNSDQAWDMAWQYYWNPSSYFNIWVVNLGGSDANSSFSFYPTVTQAITGLPAAPAGTKPFYTFGVLLNSIHSSNVEVLTHEIGHCLGLYHIFDGDGATFSSCSQKDPDYCDDTPFYNRNNYLQNVISYRFNRLYCDGKTGVSTNFMDYYNSYYNSFTYEQRKRIRHVLRYGLFLPSVSAANGRTSAAPGYATKPTGALPYAVPASPACTHHH